MITFSEQRDIAIEQILPLYELNGWSSARKPDALHRAVLNSHALVSAWDGDMLVGIGNAISDGFLVVYYPHLLVRPDYTRARDWSANHGDFAAALCGDAYANAGGRWEIDRLL
jgi:hypothetical protein